MLIEAAVKDPNEYLFPKLNLKNRINLLSKESALSKIKNCSIGLQLKFWMVHSLLGIWSQLIADSKYQYEVQSNLSISKNSNTYRDRRARHYVLKPNNSTHYNSLTRDYHSG